MRRITMSWHINSYIKQYDINTSYYYELTY